jgi:hypothetical protein
LNNSTFDLATRPSQPAADITVAKLPVGPTQTVITAPACRKVGPNQAVTPANHTNQVEPDQADQVGPDQAVRTNRGFDTSGMPV